MLVPCDRIAQIIGKAGAGLKQLREMTGCYVHVPRLVNRLEGRVDLSGSVECLIAAFTLLLQKFIYEPTCTILIPCERWSPVIGRGGENLKRICEDCQVLARLDRVSVHNPVTNDEECKLQMQGELAHVALALRYMLRHAGGQDSNLPERQWLELRQHWER